MSFRRGNQLGLKHGAYKTLAYRKWVCMKWRCRHDPHYVARGIKYCRRWERFERFFADMGPCPEGMELDRRNDKRGYSPSNCRWATRKQNQNNRQSVRAIRFQGKQQCALDWAKEKRIHYATLLHRLNVGWTIRQALTVKPRFGNRKETV